MTARPQVVFQLNSEYVDPADEERAHNAFVAWAESEGIPLQAAVKYGFRVDREPDGTLTAHYLVVDPHLSVDPETGAHSKHPESKKVTSLPDAA